MTSESKQGPVEVHFNERIWFDLDDVIQMNQGFFHGCLRYKRQAITKKNIPEEHYVFVSVTKKGMTICAPEYKRAKILVSIEWVSNNVTKKQEERQPSQRKDVSVKRRQRKASEPKEQRGLRVAPEPIVLEEHELFRDIEGQVVHVDVRGERNEEGIWFRCSDIEKLFEMENLSDNVTHTLDEGQDFEVFLLPHARTIYGHGVIEQPAPALRKRRVKAIFLSFNGLMRVIFASHSTTAKRYRDWANRICFAGLFGSDEQRVNAAADVVGVPTSSLKEVFEIAAVKVPCLYLFFIGKVVDMKKHYDELKDHKSGMLFKFGRTDNLLRRCKEHIKTYGTLKESNLRIRLWVPINPDHLSAAETEISRFLKDKKVPFQQHSETVVLSLKDLKPLRLEYERAFKMFGIETSEVAGLRDRVKELTWIMNNNEETIKLLNKTLSDMMAREAHWLKDKDNHEKERQHWIKDKETMKEQHEQRFQELKEQHEQRFQELKEQHEQRVQELKEHITIQADTILMLKRLSLNG